MGKNDDNDLIDKIQYQDNEISRLHEEIKNLSAKIDTLQKDMSEFQEMIECLTTSQIQNNDDITMMYENIKAIISPADSDDDFLGPFGVIKGSTDDDLPN